MRFLIVACALALLAGCATDPTRGYSFVSPHQPADPARQIRTVAAPVFDNLSFSPGLEALLTDAIVKEIHRATPWGVTAETRADATLRGTITGARLRKLNTDDASGLVSEMAVDLRVDFQWIDNRSGETMLARRNFHSVGAFAPGSGAREPIELGEQGAIERLARDIVHELLADW